MLKNEETVLNYLRKQHRDAATGEIYLAVSCYSEIDGLNDGAFLDALRALRDSDIISIRGNPDFMTEIPCKVTLKKSAIYAREIERNEKKAIRKDSVRYWITTCIAGLGFLLALATFIWQAVEVSNDTHQTSISNLQTSEY